jgi:hypothetical protein
VQVKSWSTPRGSDEAWRYSGLTEKRFNALAGQRRVPRLLFLVIVPPDTGAFASADEELLRLSRAAYWVSLEDLEQIENPRCERRVPVLVPRQNLLTTKTLRHLCEEADLGGGVGA